MTPPLLYIPEPVVRAATPADIVAMRAFRSSKWPSTKYEQVAHKVLRKPALLLENDQLQEHQAGLLFEAGGRLVALAALDRDAPTVGHVAAIGIDHTLHGTCVIGSGAKLSLLVLATCLQWLADDGCVAATAHVHVHHGKSKALLERLNFELVSLMDDEPYELHAVRL